MACSIQDVDSLYYEQVEKDCKPYHNYNVEIISKQLFSVALEKDGRFTYINVPGKANSDGLIGLAESDILVGVQLKSSAKLKKLKRSNLSQNPKSVRQFMDINGYESKILILLALSPDLTRLVKMKCLFGSKITKRAMQMKTEDMPSLKEAFDWLENHIDALVQCGNHPYLKPLSYKNAMLERTAPDRKEMQNIEAFENMFPFLALEIADAPANLVDFWISYEGEKYGIQLKSIHKKFAKKRENFIFASNIDRRAGKGSQNSYALTHGIDIFLFMFSDDENRERYAYMLTTFELFDAKFVDVIHFPKSQCRRELCFHPPICSGTGMKRPGAMNLWAERGFLDLKHPGVNNVIISKLLQSKTERPKIREIVGTYLSDTEIDIDELRTLPNVKPLGKTKWESIYRSAVEFLLPEFCSSINYAPFSVLNFVESQCENMNFPNVMKYNSKQSAITHALREIADDGILLEKLSLEETKKFRKERKENNRTYYRFIRQVEEYKRPRHIELIFPK